MDDCPEVRFDRGRALLASFNPVRVALALWQRLGWQSQEEVVQVIRSEDHEIPVRDVEAAGEYRLRYVSSLGAGEWDVDFRFRLKFDPTVFKVGEVVKGVRGENYNLAVSMPRDGEAIVNAGRRGTRGLSGDGLIVEIPLLVNTGAKVPQTLELVELVTTR